MLKYYAYARWVVTALPSDLNDISISCGVGNNQFVGYFLESEGARLRIRYLNNDSAYEITFIALSQDLEQQEGHWVSPALLDEVEAVDYGIFPLIT